jgi:hypothetical protein
MTFLAFFILDPPQSMRQPFRRESVSAFPVCAYDKNIIPQAGHTCGYKFRLLFEPLKFQEKTALPFGKAVLYNV